MSYNATLSSYKYATFITIFTSNIGIKFNNKSNAYLSKGICVQTCIQTSGWNKDFSRKTLVHTIYIYLESPVLKAFFLVWFSGGDDRRVLLWQAEKALSGIGVPVSMTGNHHSNIFCLAFDNQNKKIFSGGMYLSFLEAIYFKNCLNINFWFYRNSHTWFCRLMNYVLLVMIDNVLSSKHSWAFTVAIPCQYVVFISQVITHIMEHLDVRCLLELMIGLTMSWSIIYDCMYGWWRFISFPSRKTVWKRSPQHIIYVLKYRCLLPLP